jgi:hypothetical protein
MLIASLLLFIYAAAKLATPNMLSFDTETGRLYHHNKCYTIIQYTGDLDAMCPITLTPLCNIKYPIVFNNAPHQPYEAEALALWLSTRRRNPLTNEYCAWDETPLEIISPINHTMGLPTSEGTSANVFLETLQSFTNYDQVRTVSTDANVFLETLQSFTNYDQVRTVSTDMNKLEPMLIVYMLFAEACQRIIRVERGTCATL